MIHRVLNCFAATLASAAIAADLPLPTAKPVPNAQAIPLPHHEVSFQRDGFELTRFHYEPDGMRPFIYPIVGPSGRSLTRMGHPHDPVGHRHHNSVWISHHDVNGVSFWGDYGKGRIIVRHAEQFEDSADEAAVLTVAQWRAGEVTLLNERRRTAVHLLPGSEWLLLIDLQLEPAGTNDVTFGKTPFGLVGVRMAKTIGVHDGGGTLRNSEGGVNEQGVHWKPARWVDYSGPITATAREGITLMDHPANPSHPTFFHVRDDGWMGASLTYTNARVLKRGVPLRLRYGLYVHAGVLDATAIQSQWEAFAKASLPPIEVQKKK